MAARLPDIVQTDFGGGQINFALKRRDNLEFVKTGARQMQNWRIEAGGTLLNRPGKRPIFRCNGPRSEYVRMGVGAEFILNFGEASTGEAMITISSLDGTQFVSNVGPYLWTNANVQMISWCVALFDIVICFPNMQPQICRWSPSAFTWTFLPYSFRVINDQSQEPFYRFSVPGATMSYSTTTGSVTLTCSVPYFTTSMIGTLLSIVGCQCTITRVIDPQHAIVQVAYRLPDCVVLSITDNRPFQPGMIVELRDQDLKFEVSQVGVEMTQTSGLGTLNTILGVMLSDLVVDFSQFTYDPAHPDVLVSELGASTVFGYPFNWVQCGQPTVEWTEEFMCAQRGWPAACSYTAGRLCFYGFPQMEEAILWSAIGADDVCWVDPVAATRQPEAGANPDSAILEFESSRPRIVNVLEWGDVFVFTDRGIFFIPVSQANPLSPGNVEFRRFSNDGVSIIRPISTQDAIVYINAGRNRCSVVRATGSLTRPYISDDVSESHAPLFTAPASLAIATGDGPYPERYVYVTNCDGSIVVGKFTQQRTLIGWVPWITGYPGYSYPNGLATWVTTAGPIVYFTSNYGSLFGNAFLLEQEDPLAYLDGYVMINQPAPGMALPPFGPLWHLAGLTVQVVDGQGYGPRPDNIPNGCVDWGDRQVDDTGHLILLPEDGVWSGSPTVYAGIWSPPIYEPFIFPPQEGRATPGARGKRRKLQRAVVSVEHSNGFTFGKRTIPPNNWLEDPTIATGDPPWPLPPRIEWRRDFAGATGPDPNWYNIASAPGQSPPAVFINPHLAYDAPLVGSTIEVRLGSWSNAPTAFTFQWQRNGVNISGATAPSYVARPGDVGAAISCAVTATNAAGSSTASSNVVVIQP
jgi:hypothetical protein